MSLSMNFGIWSSYHNLINTNQLRSISQPRALPFLIYNQTSNLNLMPSLLFNHQLISQEHFCFNNPYLGESFQFVSLPNYLSEVKQSGYTKEQALTLQSENIFEIRTDRSKEVDLRTQEPQTTQLVSKPRKKYRQREDIWDSEKIGLLFKWVQDYRKDWKKVAKRFNQKEITPFQVKTKYKELISHNYFQLRVKFSFKEDLIIAKYFKIHGYDWGKIASYFKDRDSIMIKNRYYAHIRKKNYLQKFLEYVELLETTQMKPIEDIDVPDSEDILLNPDS